MSYLIYILYNIYTIFCMHRKALIHSLYTAMQGKCFGLVIINNGPNNHRSFRSLSRKIKQISHFNKKKTKKQWASGKLNSKINVFSLTLVVFAVTNREQKNWSKKVKIVCSQLKRDSVITLEGTKKWKSRKQFFLSLLMLWHYLTFVRS